jgi:phage tail-like protein
MNNKLIMNEKGSIGSKLLVFAAGALVFVLGAAIGVAVVGQLLGWWSGDSGPSDLANQPDSIQGAFASAPDVIDAPQAVDTAQEDPIAGYMYGVEVGDIISGYFNECFNIGSENEIVEQKVMTNSGQEIVRKIPGALKYTDVTCRRGISGNLDLWDWRQMVVEGRTGDARMPMRITLFDSASQPVAIWEFTHAWPSAISAPIIIGSDNVGVQFGVEEIVIASETMVRTK